MYSIIRAGDDRGEPALYTRGLYEYKFELLKYPRARAFPAPHEDPRRLRVNEWQMNA